MKAAWKLDATKILTRGELATVLADQTRKARRSRSTATNLMIVRLACCCGLRASEIAKLRVGDVRTGSQRPHIRIRKAVGKGGRARMIPLWWDAGTLRDVAAWAAGREPGEHFVSAISKGKAGQALTRQLVRARFRTACKVLGNERLEGLTVHHGRHSFVSHALAGGRTLAEVRDAAGHASIGTTSIYTHVAVTDDSVGNLFDFAG